MLITLLDVVSCENPDCREFGRIAQGFAARTYYCPVCGSVSHARTVDAAVTADPEIYRDYLAKTIRADRQGFSAPP